MECHMQQEDLLRDKNDTIVCLLFFSICSEDMIIKGRGYKNN